MDRHALHFDRDYTLRHIEQTPRYRHAAKAIRPDRVYADPYYPLTVTIVQLPFSLPFRCERVCWHTARLAHRTSQIQADHVELFTVLSSLTLAGTVLFDILFIGNDVLTLYKKWLYFVSPHGKNLLKTYYAKSPRPDHEPGSYEQIVIDYDYGGIYADHAHLRKVMAGVHYG